MQRVTNSHDNLGMLARHSKCIFSFNSSLRRSSSRSEEFHVKQKILNAALDHVKDHGWTKKSLELGAQSCDISDASLSMFPLGGADLALHYDHNCNKKLQDIMKEQNETREEQGEVRLPVKEFLKNIIKLRLIIQFEQEGLRQSEALALYTDPKVAPSAGKSLACLVDDIWFNAGDTSTNFSWYTKRGILAGVYGSTQLFMLQDKSEGWENTWDFLDRRLDDVEKLKHDRDAVEAQLASVKDITKSGFMVARNMLGGKSWK